MRFKKTRSTAQTRQDHDTLMRIAKIEDFSVGQHVTFRKTFTEDDVRRLVEITADVNPLHEVLTTSSGENVQTPAAAGRAAA